MTKAPNLRLEVSLRLNDVANVEILENGDWVEFSSWLSSSYKGPAEELVGDPGFMAQQAWWKANGKFFDIINLPEEMGRLCFLEVLGSRLYPTLSNIQNPELIATHIGHGTSLNHDHNHNNDLHTEKPSNLAIMRTSKLVLERVVQAFWEQARLCFARARDLQVFATNSANLVQPTHFTNPGVPLAPNSINTLQRICLDFTVREYAHAFGLNVGWTNLVLPPIQTTRVLNLANIAPRLRDLEIHFPSAKHAALGTLPNSSKFYDVVPCQKTAIDRILTFAFNHIKHVRVIRLTGCIKNSTKAKWQARFAQFRRTGNDPPTLQAELTAIDQLNQSRV